MTTEECFEKAVKRSYIVSPSALVRGDTEESIMYRVLMMSFLIHVLFRYLRMVRKNESIYVPKKETWLKRLVEFDKKWKDEFRFTIANIMIRKL